MGSVCTFTLMPGQVNGMSIISYAESHLCVYSVHNTISLTGLLAKGRGGNTNSYRQTTPDDATDRNKAVRRDPVNVSVYE